VLGLSLAKNAVPGFSLASARLGTADRGDVGNTVPG
jgi:hypothetical protein